MTALSTSIRMEPRQSEKCEGGDIVKDAALAEGTFYQSRAAGATKRRHFFSPPDAALADAVNQDADNVEYTEEEEVAPLLMNGRL